MDYLRTLLRPKNQQESFGHNPHALNIAHNLWNVPSEPRDHLYAHTLREAITYALSLARELADCQRNLIALAATRANAGGSNPFVSQAELSRLISDRRYEESFIFGSREKLHRHIQVTLMKK